MLAQRIAQQSLRRMAVQRPLATSMAKFASPAAIATNQFIQTRPVATQNMKPNEAYNILVEQRKHRPVSPHLGIYQPQITWYGSALNRITGAICSGGLYVFGAAYLVAPLIGWHLESASLAAAFGSLPLIAKVLIKSSLAFPFTYHCVNGIRHLVWDFGKWFTNKQIQVSGWAAFAVSGLSTAYLALAW
ncbi:cytochrome b560 subunit of succinate dehydrogenase [Xylona heveae TC161]|uniref:Cytochrome b560 subunit of succinate dehydrogenase n=1 Tax=Xylona heveae (strain CBS 132557 / TC161) TaxID=1328760 RepID=A0A165ADG7_XYLHT|nr:cytochrome b560 subunit of succinate dehydrogenase [Xylona heveae TC161]KZF20296.1 cytochrome b560 subunit of succinate dehydrogenase [Xylona heveae TC161]